MPPSLEAEAVRVFRRYVLEVVEALELCPYAARARLEGQSQEAVIEAKAPRDEDLLAVIDELTARADTQVAFVLLPRLQTPAPAFERRVERLRKAHANARGQTVMAIEAFHPQAELVVSDAARLVPFIRRTPDPTLQLTRLSALCQVRRGRPQGTQFLDLANLDLHADMPPPPAPLHEQIAEKNLVSVVGFGPARVKARLDAILEDRNASYRALDASVTAWPIPEPRV